jgi:uncharacterized protein (TIGR00299 family) protein
MRTLYFDCFAGISGDMTIGALIDLGVDKDVLINELKKLNINGYSISVSKVLKNGISATKFDVILKEHHNHHHGHNHSHSHEHRNIKKINDIIDNSELNYNVKKISKGIFMYVAEAEAKVHGKSIDEVHFHEVGAIDSIIDIVGTAICMDILKAESILSSSLNTGSGFVKCQHGMIPVPAPATVEIFAKVKAPIYNSGIEKELVTPTGAAIIAYLAEGFEIPEFNIEKIGYGAGKRDLEIPNVLRVCLGDSKKNINNQVCVIEANIDDMTGEIAGYVMEKLFEAGALDVFYIPIYMKKNRPAYMITIICDINEIKIFEKILFKETTTIGLRKHITLRECLKREKVSVKTAFGEMKMKKVIYENEEKLIPEYEECKRVAAEKGVSLKSIYEQI